MAARSGINWRQTPPPVRTFSNGQLLVRAGDAAATVFLIKSGHVRTFLLSEDGQDTTTGIHGTFQIVGVSSILGRATYHAFAEAIGRVEVWAWPTDRLLETLLVDRELLGLVVGALAQRLSQEVSLLGDVALHSVQERLEGIQHQFTQRKAEEPRLTNRALAHLIGARPETLSRNRVRQSNSVFSKTPATTTTPAAHTEPTSVLTYHPRQRILPPDPTGPSTMLVRSGSVRLFLEDRAGRQVCVDWVGPGEFFGVTGGLAAEAQTDVTLSVVEPDALLRLLDRKPRLAQTLMTQVGARIERVEQRLRRAHGPNASARVASLLEELAERHGQVQPDGSRLLPAGWTHAALGREVGLRRESVTRALRALAAEGRVRQRGRRLLVQTATVTEVNSATLV